MMRYSAFAAVTLLACGAVSNFAYAQEGDAAQGKTVFQRCAICHKADKGAGNGVGPNLFGIVGRKAATRPGFAYSAPLQKSGIVWTEALLTKWVAGPARMVPGTKMAFGGSTSKKQEADVAAYLATLK